MEKEKEKKIVIQTEIRKTDNFQFLFFDNYIISVVETSPKEYEFHFYKTRNFEREFILKINKEENKENEKYDIFKLIYTKNKKLYLIGYQMLTIDYDGYVERELGIFRLEIEKKIIEKIASYTINDFYIDLKEDKIYIIDYCSFITYDLLKETSNTNEKDFGGHSGFLDWEKIFLVDNYFLIVSLREMGQYFFYLFGSIIDKNFKDLDKNPENTGVKYIFPETFDLKNYFFKISDNFFLLYSEIFDNTTVIYFAEIRIKGNEDLILSLDEVSEDMESIDVCKRSAIFIDETGELIHYPIDNEKFGINISNRNIYICKTSDLELIWKFNFNFNNNEKLLLVNAEEEKEKYKLILGNKNKLLFLSS